MSFLSWQTATSPRNLARTTSIALGPPVDGGLPHTVSLYSLEAPHRPFTPNCDSPTVSPTCFEPSDHDWGHSGASALGRNVPTRAQVATSHAIPPRAATNRAVPPPLRSAVQRTQRTCTERCTAHRTCTVHMCTAHTGAYALHIAHARSARRPAPSAQRPAPSSAQQRPGPSLQQRPAAVPGGRPAPSSAQRPAG